MWTLFMCYTRTTCGSKQNYIESIKQGKKKSRIRETLNLLTDADSRTGTIWRGCEIFTESAHLADLVQQLQCLSVCLCVPSSVFFSLWTESAFLRGCSRKRNIYIYIIFFFSFVALSFFVVVVVRPSVIIGDLW